MKLNRDKVIRQCLDRLFQAVGFKQFSQRFVNKHENWYQCKSWSTAEEANFRRWMVGYLQKKLQLTPKVARHEVSWFLLDYGWTNTRNKKPNKL